QRDARLQAAPRARAVRPCAQGGRGSRGLTAPPMHPTDHAIRARPRHGQPSNVGGMDWTSVGEVREALGRERYLADEALSTALFLAGEIDQPLLLEGEAGVGKTETARAAASARGARLVRLQCHEGIDVHHALYDWDWSRQLLALRAAEHVRARLPGVPEAVAQRVCEAVARLRGAELYKLPGVGETIAWARALLALGTDDLEATLGVALKVREDLDRVRAEGVLAGA